MVGDLSKMTLEEEAKIVALCRRLGIPLLWQPDMEQDHPWMGYALNMAHPSGMVVSDLCHDIGHWLVAHPLRRFDPHFCLNGYNFAGWEYEAPSKAVDAEEERASMLGILIERSLGVGDWRETFHSHNWADYGMRGKQWPLGKVIRSLQQDGHLRGLLPSCVEGL